MEFSISATEDLHMEECCKMKHPLYGTMIAQSPAEVDL